VLYGVFYGKTIVKAAVIPCVLFLHSSSGQTSMANGANRQLSMIEDEGHDSGSDSYHSTASSYVSLTDIEV